jgi:hypothetical protein
LASLAWLSAWLLAAMVADTVVVDVEPLDDRASFAVIDACNRALGETRCVLLSAPPAASGVPAKQPPITRVRIALSSEAVERAAIAFEAGGVLGPVRILEFEASDPLEERYRAIGLVIASRLLEEAARLRNEPPVQDTIPPRPKPASKRLGFETALFLGQGLDEGDLRWGLRTRALVRPFERIPVSALFAVRLGLSASADGQPSMRWTSVGLGLQGAVPVFTEALQLELHAEGALQFVNVSLEDPATGAKDSGSETRTGTIAGVQLAWAPLPFWAFFVGAESSLFWPPLILEVRRAEVAKEDPLRFSAHLGQRLSF